MKAKKISNATARAIFKTNVLNTNFMTPDAIMWMGNSGMVCELSEGTYFDGVTPMYGVTVITLVNGVWSIDTDYSKCGGNKEELVEYMKTLVS